MWVLAFRKRLIYKWQRGECLPTFDNMYAMACFFHVKVDEILVGNRQDFDIFWLQRIPHGWSATQFRMSYC